jgi:hypothetical protein
MSLEQNRTACRELGLPTRGSNKDLAMRLRAHRERNLTPPTQETVDGILVSGFQCEDSTVQDEIDHRAREVFERVMDEATTDRAHEPIRWGNAPGLTILEQLDDHTKQIVSLTLETTKLKEELKSETTKLNEKLTSVQSDLAAMKATSTSYYAVRSRFFAVYLRDKLGKATRADLKIIKEGNIAVHEGDPLTDAMMYKIYYLFNH